MPLQINIPISLTESKSLLTGINLFDFFFSLLPFFFISYRAFGVVTTSKWIPPGVYRTFSTRFIHEPGSSRSAIQSNLRYINRYSTVRCIFYFSTRSFRNQCVFVLLAGQKKTAEVAVFIFYEHSRRINFTCDLC